MKNTTIISMVTLALLGTMGLQAQEIKGQAAAKAKVEEAAAKEQFKAKEDRTTFKKEAAGDLKKVDAPEKVKELEAKEKAAAPTETKAFKEEAKKDLKKTIR